MLTLLVCVDLVSTTLYSYRQCLSSMPSNTVIHTYHRLRSYIWYRIWFRSSDRLPFRAPAHQGAVRRDGVRRAREVRIRDGIRNFYGFFYKFPLRQSFLLPF